MDPAVCDSDLVGAPMWAPDTEWETKKKNVFESKSYPPISNVVLKALKSSEHYFFWSKHIVAI